MHAGLLSIRSRGPRETPPPVRALASSESHAPVSLRQCLLGRAMKSVPVMTFPPEEREIVAASIVPVVAWFGPGQVSSDRIDRSKDAVTWFVGTLLTDTDSVGDERVAFRTTIGTPRATHDKEVV